MNKRANLVLVLVICAVMNGCTTMQLVKPGKTKWKSSKFSSTLPVGWVRFSSFGNWLSLTRDGQFLQYISLSHTKTNKELKNTKVKLTEDLLIQEVADIIKNELSLTPDISGFESVSLKPATLDGLEAFRLEYTYKNKELVDYHGIVYGFILNKKYYEIQYSAMEQHYYKAGLQAFEDFVKDFRVDRP